MTVPPLTEPSSKRAGLGHTPAITTPGAHLGQTKSASVTKTAVPKVTQAGKKVSDHQHYPQKLEIGVVTKLSAATSHSKEELDAANHLIQEAETAIAGKQAEILSNSQILSATSPTQSKLQNQCEELKKLVSDIKSSLTNSNLKDGQLAKQLEISRETIKIYTELAEENKILSENQAALVLHQNALERKQELISQQLALDGRPRSPKETAAQLTSIYRRFMVREEKLKEYATEVVSLKYQRSKARSHLQRNSNEAPQVKMEKSLAAYREQLKELSNEVETIEADVNNALNQLGIAACNSAFNGAENTELRKNIIRLFSDIALLNWRLPKESQIVSDKIKLAHVKYLRTELDAKSADIRQFKHSSDVVDALWLYYQVKNQSMVHYQETTAKMKETLDALHSEARAVHAELRQILSDMKPIAYNPNYPAGLAYDDADQIKINKELFEKSKNTIEESQNNLRNSIINLRNELLVAHKEFRMQLAYLSYVTADDNPEMQIVQKGWRQVVTIDPRELPVDPLADLPPATAVTAAATTSSTIKASVTSDPAGASYFSWLWGSSLSSSTSGVTQTAKATTSGSPRAEDSLSIVAEGNDRLTSAVAATPPEVGVITTTSLQ